MHRLAMAHLEPKQNQATLPFDLYCPSVSGDVHKRVCICGKYFPSHVALKEHKIIHNESHDEPIESDEPELSEPAELTEETTDVVIVRNLFEWLTSEFTE